MGVHHIRPHADGGQDTFENAIPLYFDHHAEVGQYEEEKKEHERVRKTDPIKIS